MDPATQEVDDLETGESCLDCETGEIKLATKCHRKCLAKYQGTKVTISTNDETGEPEWVYEDRSNAKHPNNPRKFHIPTPVLSHEKRSGLKCLFYCNSILVFLSMVCFYPALAALLGVLLEASKHAWFHRRDGKLPPEKRHVYRFHRSPIHKFVSEFCAICQADRMVYMVGKIQDARLRMKGRAVGTGVRGCVMPGTQVLTTG